MNETDILKAKLADAFEESRRLKADLDMYVRAWARELGGKVIPKTHMIDSLVLTTRAMREELERLRSEFAVRREREVADSVVALFG